MADSTDPGPSDYLGWARKAAGVTEEQILAAYLFGSRIYGTATPESDADVMVVVADDAPPFKQLIEDAKKANLPFTGPYEVLKETPIGDLTFVQRTFWEYGLQQNWIEYLSMYCTDQELKVKETFTVDWKLNFMKIKYAVYKYCHDHVLMAQKAFKQKNPHRARKVSVHSLRKLMYGIQLVKTQRVHDVKAANDWYYECLKTEFPTWKDLHTWYSAKEAVLMEEFKAIVNIYKDYPVPISHCADNSSKLHLVTLLRSRLPGLTEASHPPEKLTTALEFVFRELAITTVSNRKMPRLVEFRNNQPSAPNRSRSVLEAAGLVLDAYNNWNVVCFPPFKSFNLDEDKYASEGPYVPLLDVTPTSNIRVYEKVVGLPVNLYLYAGEWRVSYYPGTNFYSSSLPRIFKTSSVHDIPKEVEELFFKTVGVEKANKNHCYSFVFKYEAPQATLVAARDLQTFDELEIEPIGAANGWACAPDVTSTLFPKGLAAAPDWRRQLITLASRMSFYFTNGFVLVDLNPNLANTGNTEFKSFQRLKLRSYVYIFLLESAREPWIKTAQDIAGHLLHATRVFASLCPVLPQDKLIETLRDQLSRVAGCDLFAQWYECILTRLDALCTFLDPIFVAHKEKTGLEFAKTLDELTVADKRLQVHHKLLHGARRLKYDHLLDFFRDKDRLHDTSGLKLWLVSIYEGAAGPNISMATYHNM